MLRHSPLPPLVLGAALALGIALTGARTDAPPAPAFRGDAAPPPGEAGSGAPADGPSRAWETRLGKLSQDIVRFAEAAKPVRYCQRIRAFTEV